MKQNESDININKLNRFILKLNLIDWEPIAFKLMNPDNNRGWSLDKTIQCIDVYRKFLCLKYLYPDFILVPSQETDHVWHCHILDTAKYREDCHFLFGSFLDHWPYLGLNGESDRKNLEDRFNQTNQLFQQHFNIDQD